MVMAKKEKMNKIICPSCGIDNSLDLNTCNSCKSSLKLNNKYYLIDVIGENNQITYLGKASLQEPQASDFVIIKELSIASLENWKNKELFEREISVLNSLDHPQIPKLIEHFKLKSELEETYYLVMEYIEGISLKDEIDNKRYSEVEALLLIKELLNILDYLHSFSPPIVHRDIKPSNIIRRKSDNKLVLIDFGAVTEALKVEGGSTIVGTYGYMAPEQFMGNSNIQSDFYSLGAIIIKLLTKQDPYELIEASNINFIDKINVSEHMKEILRKLLALDLDKRVKSTKEIHELIKKHTEGGSLSLSKCISPKELNPEDIIKKYKKLEGILKKVEAKKNKKIFGFLKYIHLAILPSILIYLTNDLIDSIVFISLIFLVFVVFSFLSSNRNTYKLFLKNTSPTLFESELIVLFIEEKINRLNISEYEAKDLKNKSNNLLSIDTGKYILYKNILKDVRKEDYFD